MFEQTTLFDGQKSTFFDLKDPTKTIAGLMARTSLLKSREEMVQYLFDFIQKHEELSLQEMLQVKVLILQVIKQLNETLKKQYSLQFARLSEEIVVFDPKKRGEQLLEKIESISEEITEKLEIKLCISLDAAVEKKMVELERNVQSIAEKLHSLKRVKEQMDRSEFPQELLEELSAKYFEKNKQLLVDLKGAKMELFTACESVVEAFSIQTQDIGQRPVFEVKEELKQYQKFVKDLSLSANGFHKLREKLGMVWEQLKELEKKRKEQKKQLNQKAEFFSGKLDLVQKKKQNTKALENTLEQMQHSLKKTNLFTEDRRKLQKKIQAIEEPILEKKKEIDALKKNLSESQIAIQDLPDWVLNQEKNIDSLVEETRSLDLYVHLDENILRIVESSSLTDEANRFLKERLERLKKARAKSNLDFEQSFILTQRVDLIKSALCHA